jgi:hypothetical protein
MNTTMLRRRPFFVALALVTVAVAALPARAADVTIASAMDDTPTLRRMTFPVDAPVRYSDDWGDCRGTACERRHQGNDLLGAKLDVDVAANDGRVTWVQTDASGNAGNMLVLEDAQGWEYWYLHLNNDTPGTDDGANPKRWILYPGIKQGSKVKAGQPIAYLGDSGNAEGTSPHTHFELHRPDGTAVDPYHSLRLAQGLTADPWCAYPSNPTPHPSASAGRGYWLLGPNGAVYPYGTATSYGGANTAPHSGSVVDLVPTATGKGYWIATSTGEVLTFGDAAHHGDMRGVHLNAPIVGMDVTPGGDGYWLFAGDGGVFTFGAARFHGSTGDQRLNAPVVGMAVPASGRGYWLFARDGGVFSFGDATFHGSTGAITLNSPMIGMVRSAGGQGYLLLGGDGGTFTFGDARFYGSFPGFGKCDAPTATAVAPTRTGRGYWILAGDGRVFGFGDAKTYGDRSKSSVHPVALAVVPA